MYNYNYNYDSPMDETVLMTIVGSCLVVLLVALIVGIVFYIMRSIALYTIAKRRGLNNPWLAWIPVGSEWIIGSISDQYRYLVKGENKSKRKILLGLSLANCIGGLILSAFLILFVVRLVMSAGAMSDSAVASMLIAPVLGMSGLSSFISVVSIVFLVFRCMAMYDVYRSCDSNNAVLYLVLGIVFGFLEPIFLLVVRKKDGGMPPRRDTFIPESRAYDEPWQEQ